jgi:sec-independent protein translocase protein TatA
MPAGDTIMIGSVHSRMTRGGSIIMLGDIGMPELLVILAIVAIIFGANRLPELGKSLGTAIKGFKQAVKDETTKDS